nr:von Willebrand factor A domain-containing protein 7-like [Penaeus vannamei]
MESERWDRGLARQVQPRRIEGQVKKHRSPRRHQQRAPDGLLLASPPAAREGGAASHPGDEYYLTLVRGAVGDDLFVRFLSLYPTPALVLVLDTTDSMDKELAALVHTANRLVQQHASATYPPAEYLFVPFNDPSEAASRFV